MAKHFPYKLYLVAGASDCLHFPIEQVIESAIKGGVDIVQLREKNIYYKDFLQLALKIKEITDRYHVPLIINDHIKVAIDVKADGIHVGQYDSAPSTLRSILSKKQIIGYSVEELSQINTTDSKAADYIAASPVFATPTKTNTKYPWGLTGLQTLRSKTTQPIVAIGGIHHENVQKVIEAGADCIAVVSAITKSDNPQKAAELLRTQIEKACSH